MVTTMLPELAGGLHTSLATAASSLTVYLIPFAAIMLVSGTLAEHWGRARTIRLAYLVYALASLACALAPGASTFLAARAVQGAANAFTTPLLVAVISDVVPPAGLGRALGRFGGWQAAGQAFAPLVGGLAAALDYRFAFLAAAAAAVLLGIVTSAESHEVHADHRAAPASESPWQRWRSLRNRPLALACAVAFGLYLASSGLNILAALLAHDRLGLGPDQRGLVIAAFGVAGLLTGARLGRVADRIGLRRFGVIAATLLATTIALAGLATTVLAAVVAMAVAGAASTAGRLTSTSLAVTSTPGNRAGATSVALAWQFLGSALAPVAFLPLYRHHVEASFLLAGAGAAAAALLLALPVKTLLMLRR